MMSEETERLRRALELRDLLERCMEDCIGVKEGQSFEDRAEELMVTEAAYQNASSILTDALTFLKREHKMDEIALALFNKGGLPFTESDEAMKTFRTREALIARVESATPDQKETTPP